jgi:ATP-dependent Clp protease ATP-binding subunit ClpA
LSGYPVYFIYFLFEIDLFPLGTMTSNIGSQYYANGRVDDATRNAVTDELKRHFRPEFLNRVDDIVIFHSLAREHLAGIVGIQLNRFAERLAAQGIAFSADDSAKLLLAEKGYDPVYGVLSLNALLKSIIDHFGCYIYFECHRASPACVIGNDTFS